MRKPISYRLITNPFCFDVLVKFIYIKQKEEAVGYLSIEDWNKLYPDMNITLDHEKSQGRRK